MMKTRKGNSMAKVSTYRAMISALVCTFLCVAMLCGMTYAWYLGTIDSGSNTINIGTYDVSVKWASNELPATFTSSMTDGQVNFNVTGMGPGDVKVCYFQINNDTAYPANLKIYAQHGENTGADLRIYAASVTGTYVPVGVGTDLTTLADETAISPEGGFTVPAKSGNTAGTLVVAVAVKLPGNSMAVNATTDFTLKFNVQQTGNS